ncbi:MAG: PA0069 family radical SAM protein [Gemmatimonadales bacterium]|nr:MAG: PA0069 family radical SAM protein [Gemmatimonadales bacterium]
MERQLPQIRSRGTPLNPSGRFEPLSLEATPGDAWEPDGGWEPNPEEADRRPTRVFRDATRSILTRNRSPDVGFDWSLNPYRGCEHGCVYCYARPTHEYLGFSAGLDFESRILAKMEAATLLRGALASPRWSPQTLVMSGVTDPYQPVESRLGITRGCLEVLAECRHPVALITKSRRVLRDLDLLGELAAVEAAHVTVSVTTLDRDLQRALEPRASSPEARLEAIRGLAGAGVPVAVNVAPVIPGLTDHEIPAILEAAAAAGAEAAGFVLLRLPFGVKDLFMEWVGAHRPDRAGRILSRIRETREGALYRSPFGTRMRGTGEYARQIEGLFTVSARRFGLDRRSLGLSVRAFRRPASKARGPRSTGSPGPSSQMDLFQQEMAE